MSQATFSQDLGILEAGSDYKGFLKNSDRTLDYFSPVRSIPSMTFPFWDEIRY